MTDSLPYRTKTDLAVHALRELITSGEISAGTHVTYAGLAQRLGISPTPVREAVRILESEGLMRQQPHKGPTVAELEDLSVAEAQDLYTVREILEREATRLAAGRLGPDELDHLHELRTLMEQAKDPKEMRRHHNAWHFALYEASGSRYLTQMITWTWNRFPWEAVWLIPGRRETAMAQHRALEKALYAGDADSAAAHMSEHIVSGRDAVIAHVATRAQ